MKTNKKNMFSIVAILMLLTFVVSIFANTGITNAQTTEKATFPFIDAVPKTVGVGQKVLINYGLLNYLQMDGDGWNVTAEITSPSGKVDTLKGMTWSTGTRGDSYTPTEVGEYELQCIHESEYYNAQSATYRGYYAASKSDIVILTVQEESVPEHPGYGGLPDSYWTRPVDSQLREWWSVMGSWVAAPRNLFAPYNAAPESAHILWSMPIGDTFGGVSGGDNWQISYQNGDAYEGKFAGSIIIAGVLYYNRYVSNSPQQQIVAVNLHTGKILWEKSYNIGNGRIGNGQVLTWLSMNNRGTFAYIWITSGTNMFALDAKNGDLKYNMTNVPSGTIYWGPSGEMLKFALTNLGTAANPNYYLTKWNSSYVVNKDKGSTADAWGSQVQGVTYNATQRGYDLNVSVSTNVVFTGSVLTVFPGDRIIVGSATASQVTLSAISLEEGREGQVLFRNVAWQSPAEWSSLTMTTQSRWAAFSDNPYVAVFWTKENRVNYVFSLENGKFLWKSDPHGYADAWTNAGMTGYIAYGNLYEASISGVVYCYNATNGDELWTYEATDKYAESYITPNWWLAIVFISDNKVYLGHMEHSPQEPIPRGAPFFALDAHTGNLIWEINGAFRQTLWGGRALIGDSIIATSDTYDNRIYAIGRGPSSMTVTAPDVAVAANTPVLIRGTIMDVSPGTESDEMRLRFPNGVPAVADKYMSDWMLHVYKQFPEPIVDGVEITIDAIDPNGNYVSLGTAVSDVNGRFSFSFTPDKDGEYKIYAIFDGSASYYRTDAQTELIVTSTEVVSEPPYAFYALIVGIVIIIIMIIFGLLNLIKKK